MNKAFVGVRAAAVALTAAALVAGCSSTTSGNATSGGGSNTSGGFGSSAGASASAGGSGGGSLGTGNFCHDWNTINSDLTDITSGNVREKLVSKFDTLAAEAPAAVKSDLELIDHYVHSLVSGNPDTGKAQQIGQAFGHVGVWIAQNC